MSSLSDLFEFLSSPNPDARELALQNLAGHTPKSSPNRHIFIPSALAGLPSSGLGGSTKAKEEDARKVQALKDLCELCRDQAVRRSPHITTPADNPSKSRTMPCRR